MKKEYGEVWLTGSVGPYKWCVTQEFVREYKLYIQPKQNNMAAPSPPVTLSFTIESGTVLGLTGNAEKEIHDVLIKVFETLGTDVDNLDTNIERVTL